MKILLIINLHLHSSGREWELGKTYSRLHLLDWAWTKPYHFSVHERRASHILKRATITCGLVQLHDCHLGGLRIFIMYPMHMLCISLSLGWVADLRSALIPHGCCFVKICEKPKWFFIFWFSFLFPLQIFCEYIFHKPSQAHAHLLGEPRGLRSFSHMLNVIITPTKRHFLLILSRTTKI